MSSLDLADRHFVSVTLELTWTGLTRPGQFLDLGAGESVTPAESWLCTPSFLLSFLGEIILGILQKYPVL
jgi:hypothetical protein